MGKKKKKKRQGTNGAQNKTAQLDLTSDKSTGLLVTTAQQYHLSYAEAIAYEVEYHKHLSVLLPAMIGLYPLPLNLYDGLAFRCREYIIVEKQEDVIAFNNMLITEQDENKCIYPVLFEDFVERKPVGGCYVLFDLPQDKRMELSSILSKNNDAVVISVGKLVAGEGTAKSSMVSQAQDVMTELYQITMKNGRPHCMVFPVESILDIRDLMYAGAPEKSKLVSDLYNICSEYETDYGVTDEMTKSSGSAEKIAQLKKMLAEKDFEISILKSLAASAGVDMGGLETGISRITNIKQEYAEKIDQTTDSFEQEKLETAFQNEVSDLLVKVTGNMMTPVNKNAYEKGIVDQLGENVWNKHLSERSRNYLISAMMTFDSMNKIPDRNTLDYSGVCLQITKVLDEELTARFYTQYKRYLYDNYLLRNWPEAMVSRYGDEPLAPSDFTIGSVAYVVGANRQGRIVDQSSFDIMREFAKACLYKDGMNDREIREHLIKCVECAEKTRRDYRNPAAHREAMSYISARECIDYLIEQTKMLKLILQDMRD